MYSRHSFLGKLIAVPAGLWLNNYYTSGKVTAIKAIQLDFQFDGSLIKIETDAGFVGYMGKQVSIPGSHVTTLNISTGLYREQEADRRGL